MPRFKLLFIRALVAAGASAGALSFLTGCTVQGPLGGRFTYTPPVPVQSVLPPEPAPVVPAK